MENNIQEQIKNLDMSNFSSYSYGVVVEDNPDNNTEIKIFPTEKLYVEGKLLDITDLKGVKFKYRKITKTGIDEPIYVPAEELLEHDHTKYMLADWVGMHQSNRITPPNVCKGEHVMLYRYSNADSWFWDTLNTDLALRKEEHVVYSYSAKPELDDTEDIDADRYTVTVSTRDKYIKIHTTDKHGEYTTYDLTINTKDGVMNIIDGKDNEIKLDSANDLIEFRSNKKHHEETDDVVTDARVSVEVNTPKETHNVDDDYLLNSTTDKHVASEMFEVETADEKHTIENNLEIELSKVKIKNDTGELIALLLDWMDAHIQVQHIGNLGIPTAMYPTSMAQLQQIKIKLETFKV